MIDLRKINLNYIYEITVSDLSFRELLLRTAHTEISEDLIKIKEFRALKNWPDAGSMVHKFKSKVDLFNLRGDLEIFRDMERTLRYENPSDEEAQEMVDDFITIQEAILHVFESQE